MADGGLLFPLVLGRTFGINFRCRQTASGFDTSGTSVFIGDRLVGNESFGSIRLAVLVHEPGLRKAFLLHVNGNEVRIYSTYLQLCSRRFTLFPGYGTRPSSTSSIPWGAYSIWLLHLNIEAAVCDVLMLKAYVKYGSIAAFRNLAISLIRGPLPAVDNTLRTYRVRPNGQCKRPHAWPLYQ